ncbi:phospholipase A2 group [Chamberlinius hualienensis]
MTTVLRLYWICVTLSQVFGYASEETGKKIPPRSIITFADMILQESGKNPFRFITYGRYCGYGSEEGPPVDETDACCQIHDMCYDKLLNTSGCQPYIDKYDFMREKLNLICVQSDDKCAFGACECDLSCARCFKNSTYDSKHVKLNKLVASFPTIVQKIRSYLFKS